MLSLNKSEYLNEWLNSMIQNIDIAKIGVGFINDLDCLNTSYPHMTCFKNGIQNYVDLVDCFMALHPTKRSGGLAGISEQLFGKTVCKVEQVSNWARRPLRKAQLHYAALDAHIQIYIWKKFIEKIQDQGITTQQFLKSLKKKSELKDKKQKMEAKVLCNNCNSKMHNTQECKRGVRCRFCSVFGHNTVDCSFLTN